MSNNSQNAITTAIAYSYISFIDHYLEVLKNPMLSSVAYLDEEIALVCEEMKTLFQTLPSLVGSEQDFKQPYIEKLINYRTLLEQKHQAIGSYKRELNHLTISVTKQQGVDALQIEEGGMSIDEILDMDFDALGKDCTNFVFNGLSHKDKQDRAAALLPFIPMRMTKESFLDYVEKSLLYIDIDDTDEHIALLLTLLRQLLDGKLNPDYGKTFKDFALSLEELQIIDDYDVFFEEADLLDETLTNMTTILSELYRMICTFSNLLIFDALTFEMLVQMNPSFSDLYYSIKSILDTSEDADLFIETLPERVADIKVPIAKNYERQAQKVTMDPLFSLISLHLVMDINDSLGFEAKEEPTSSHEILASFKDFISELKEYLLAHKPFERKLRMQYFISQIPFIMSDVNFEQYVQQGFKNVREPAQNAITALQLAQALESSGFFEESETEHMTHEVDDAYTDEHHHDYDCEH